MSHPTDDGVGRPSRRRFLQGVGGFAALAASFGASRNAAGGPRPGGARPAPGGAAVELQGPRITVREVDAYPIYINQRSEGLLDPPVFDGDDDPRRWRWGGPFEQLPSAIIAVIKTDQGIVGFGMGAGGTAAVEIIRGHLRHLLIGTSPLDVEQRWDQMYSSGVLYGRRGLFPMALSAVDNALWDIAGQYAERPVMEMIGGWPRERLAIYQTGGNIPEALARGVRNFKIGTPVGPHTPPDEQRRVVDRILAARDTIGTDANLMIDCVSRNGTADWAVGYAQQLRPAALYFMEELLSPDDVFGYAELVQRIGGGGPGWTRVACGARVHRARVQRAGAQPGGRDPAARHHLVRRPDRRQAHPRPRRGRRAGADPAPRRQRLGAADRVHRTHLHHGRELPGRIGDPRRDVGPLRQRRLRRADDAGLRAHAHRGDGAGRTPAGHVLSL